MGLIHVLDGIDTYSWWYWYGSDTYSWWYWYILYVSMPSTICIRPISYDHVSMVEDVSYDMTMHMDQYHQLYVSDPYSWWYWSMCMVMSYDTSSTVIWYFTYHVCSGVNFYVETIKTLAVGIDKIQISQNEVNCSLVNVSSRLEELEQSSHPFESWRSNHEQLDFNTKLHVSSPSKGAILRQFLII